MKRFSVALVLVFFCTLSVQSAFAGAPLKGIGVSLGKSPGGGCASRVSGANGEASFGVWPKGNYTVSLSAANAAPNARGAKPETLHVEIRGAVGGPATHVLSAATAERLAPFEVISDGKTPLVVKVSDGTGEPLDAARVKSHPNSANN